MLCVEELINPIRKQIESISLENDWNLFYGAVLNSIANGIQRSDSDIDTKFFYVPFNQDGFDIESIDINSAVIKKETYVKIRDNTNGIECDSSICWDIRYFLMILVNPSKPERKIPPILYYQVPAVLMSPYKWDLYGLANKLLPLFAEICDYNMLIAYFQDKIVNRMQFGQCNEYTIKQQRSIIHSLFSIKYILNYLSLPPMPIDQLLEPYGVSETISMEPERLFEVDRIAKEYLHLKEEYEKRRNDYSSRISVSKQLQVVYDMLGIINDSIKKS